LGTNHGTKGATFGRPKGGAVMKPEEPSTPDDAFFKRVTDLVLIELAKEFPDQADRAAALLGLVITEIAAVEDREDRMQICTTAYRSFYLGSLGHDLAEAAEAIEFEC
jgi:hypothetical protein